jgi:serine/threonine protein kinase
MPNLPLPAGSLFANQFEIVSAAGSGGMGIVYRARDRASGELVALKILHGDGQGYDEGGRFIREAQILAELRHPGIVSYVAHGDTPQGQRYLAMQWLAGEDLSKRLARGPLSLAEVLTLARNVTEALAFAHQRGIIHRDLKPSNLFLPDGDIERVKILDFGIARRLTTPRNVTRTGTIVGTPEYMAPEQARGVRELTPAADLFSLGCVLYECLTGEPPFSAEHIAAVLVRILFEEPVPVAQRRTGIPEGLGELLGRMLIKDPAGRPLDAREVSAALQALATLGDLSDRPSHRTLDATVVSTPPPAATEQVLLSLVLAMPPPEIATEGTAEISIDPVAELSKRSPLLAELRELGAQADILLSGALVVTVPQMASAQDQAALAARCAAVVRERWPDTLIAVVTGRGMRNGGSLTGEVLDRAWRLLEEPASPAPRSPTTPTAIRIDEVSAGLLQTRYEIERLPATPDGFALGGERIERDAGRQLLGRPTPCVGRERELSTLEAVLAECRDNAVARAMLVLAPPGMGKSRLRHEFLRRLESRGEAVVTLLGRGDPMKAKSTYGLLGEALRQKFEIHDVQEPALQRARLRERLGQRLPKGDVERVSVFLGELCGVPFPDEDNPQLRAARQDPQIMSEQVERAWLDALKALHTEESLLLVLDDLHWSDGLTVKLVNVALRRLRDFPLMVLALARPEVADQHPNLWAGVVQPLPLQPLVRKAGERLARQVLGGDVSSDQIARIVEQAAGNPLFLEELIRAASERKSGELPATVAAMIQARISRLAARSRRALRAASVFGETFWENGVRNLLGTQQQEDTAYGALDDLVREEIIEKTVEGRFAGETQYRFRHGLVRDAAYSLVSTDEKIAWHAAAGEFLAKAGEHRSFVLAEHYRLGHELQKALRYYVRAGEQSYDAGDTELALLCIDHALSCGAEEEEQATLLSFKRYLRTKLKQTPPPTDTPPGTTT